MNEKKPDRIEFYRTDRDGGFLSNLAFCEIAFEGEGFRSSEHAYQYGKPKDPMTKEWIRRAPFPRLAAIAGHGLFFYDIVENWNQIKVSRMLSVLRAKFHQHPDLGKQLVATGAAFLVEGSKTDPFWGEGKTGKGANALGKLLMRVRDELVHGEAAGKDWECPRCRGVGFNPKRCEGCRGSGVMMSAKWVVWGDEPRPTAASGEGGG